VGAVIVRPDKTIASVGYNGFPRGVQDLKERYDDRETKYAYTVHGEMNAILNASEKLDGYTLYIYPAFASPPTCDRCAVHVIQSGITRVVGIRGQVDEALLQRWQGALERASTLYKEAGVEVDMV
jgi:dCMP deaminase